MTKQEEEARIAAAVQKQLEKTVTEQQKQYSKMMEKAMKDSLKGVDKANASLEKERHAVQKELEAAQELRSKAEREGEKMAQEFFAGKQKQFTEAAKTELLRELVRMHIEVGKTTRDIAVWLDVPMKFVENIRALLERLTQYAGDKPNRLKLEGNPKLRYVDMGRGGTMFTILQKDPNHHSSKYNNAPMLFQERLTLDGVALHAGGLPGYPESHGCVHLPLEFAKLLFGITHLGGTVIVAGAAGDPTMVPDPGVLGPTNSGFTQPLAPGSPFRWQPQLSPTGPVTIVISRSDQNAVVLRNGVEIGRSRVRVPNDDFQTHVMTYSGQQNGRAEWIYAGVPGHGAEAGKPADSTILSGADMPPAFVAAVSAIITPGATILLTEAPLTPATTGKSLTVLDGTK